MAETESHWDVLKDMLAVGQIRGPTVHDARIAAICIGHGVAELWTARPGFQSLSDSRYANPLLR